MSPLFFFYNYLPFGTTFSKKINVVLFRNEEEKIQILVLIDLKHFYKTNQQTDNVCLKKVLWSSTGSFMVCFVYIISLRHIFRKISGSLRHFRKPKFWEKRQKVVNKIIVLAGLGVLLQIISCKIFYWTKQIVLLCSSFKFKF